MAESDTSLDAIDCLDMNSNNSLDESFGSREEGHVGKRKVRVKDEKACRVCGDKALGYNFNAVTCESCKAFFRRNALKDAPPKCLFTGSCSIDIRTRRFCPFCRLKKCFDIGMKKDMILDDQERKARMAKVLQNRQRRQTKPSIVTVKEEPQSEPEAEQTPDQTPDSVYSPTFENISPNNSMPMPHLPTWRPQFEAPPVPAVVEKSCLPSSPGSYRQLRDDERSLLSELSEAYRTTLGGFVFEQHVEEAESYQNVNDLVNNSELAVRRLIKFVKMLEDFRKLCQEDQIAALKACVLNTLLLRSVTFYSVEKDAWITPNGEIPTSILKEATGFLELHDSHTSYCRHLKTVVGNDCTIMAMLQVITIFNPDGANLKMRDFISDLQDKYIVMLKHYLESEFTFANGRSYFGFLLQKMSELKGLSDEHASVLLQVNPTEIEPLMLEVLNLK